MPIPLKKEEEKVAKQSVFNQLNKKNTVKRALILYQKREVNGEFFSMLRPEPVDFKLCFSK